MTHLFINITIQDGEHEHTHKVLHTTNCTNLEFAINWYVAHYWGFSEKEIDYKRNCWWEWHGGLRGKVDSWVDIPEKDYKILRLYI